MVESPIQKVLGNGYLVEQIFNFLPLGDKLKLMHWNDVWKKSAEMSLKKEKKIIIKEFHRHERPKDAVLCDPLSTVVDVGSDSDDDVAFIHVQHSDVISIVHGRTETNPFITLGEDLGNVDYWTSIFFKCPNIEEITITAKQLDKNDQASRLHALLSSMFALLPIKKFSMSKLTVESWPYDSSNLEELEIHCMFANGALESLVEKSTIKRLKLNIFGAGGMISKLPKGLEYLGMPICHREFNELLASPAAETVQEIDGKCLFDTIGSLRDLPSTSTALPKLQKIQLAIVSDQAELENNLIFQQGIQNLASFLRSLSNLECFSLVLSQFSTEQVEHLFENVRPQIINHKLKEIAIYGCSSFNRNVLRRLAGSQSLEDLKWLQISDNIPLNELLPILQELLPRRLRYLELATSKEDLPRVTIPEALISFVEAEQFNVIISEERIVSWKMDHAPYLQRINCAKSQKPIRPVHLILKKLDSGNL